MIGAAMTAMASVADARQKVWKCMMVANLRCEIVVYEQVLFEKAS